jgi:hypothetical protein
MLYVVNILEFAQLPEVKLLLAKYLYVFCLIVKEMKTEGSNNIELHERNLLICWSK